jgi:hypothetical protein
MLYAMPKRRRRRRAAKEQRRSPRSSRTLAARDLEMAARVERLAYTRRQASEALGVSLATLDRRVVPAIMTVKTEWGARLIPVAELERYLVERSQEPRSKGDQARRPGRKPRLAPEVTARIGDERAQGRSLGEIARRLNEEAVPTSQGGRQWWPSTVRAVLLRSKSPGLGACPETASRGQFKQTAMVQGIETIDGSDVEPVDRGAG